MKPIPTLRPRRAKQVPSALADGCDPVAGCRAGQKRVLVRTCTVASPQAGPLLHVPARLPLKGREKFLTFPFRGKVGMGVGEPFHALSGTLLTFPFRGKVGMGVGEPFHALSGTLLTFPFRGKVGMGVGIKSLIRSCYVKGS